MCPETGQAEGMFFSSLNSSVLNEFLKQISQEITFKKHAVIVLDQAGYHISKTLKIPENISLIHLPSYSPELNPVENLWHYFRSHYWSNGYYKDIDALCETAQVSWEAVCFDEEKIKTICAVHYI